jgi:arabinan endo-1,5-alpha-L-arabinosidase
LAGFLCSQDAPRLLELEGDITRVHDPVIAREGDSYYIFCTGGSIRRSGDLRHWTITGKVFSTLPEWALAEIPGVRGGYWAPDISRHGEEFRLYYSVSTFGKNDSAIGLATNHTLDPDRPDYKWNDRGMVLRSHKDDDFNAIDPNLAVDRQGREWLVFGSFWSGIKMRRIDAATGMLSGEDTRLYSLAARPVKPPSIEAPFIVRHGEYDYLFVSFDMCCRGAKSTYNVVAGRSPEITGPYLDAAGTPMLQGGGTTVIKGSEKWPGVGHQGFLAGADLMVFHAYSASSGIPELQISTITWSDGWPHAAAMP